MNSMKFNSLYHALWLGAVLGLLATGQAAAKSAQEIDTDVDAALQAFHEILPHLTGIPDDIILDDILQRGVSGGAGNRIAAEGSVMVPKNLRSPFFGQHSADRDAAAQSLGQSHNIRLNAEMLISKKPAGAAHSGLNFIEDKQETPSIAKISYPFKITF